MNHQILIVDDEPNVRLTYRTALESQGDTVIEADGGARALLELARQHFDIAILDLRMPEMDGLDLLAEMRRRGFPTPTVFSSAYGELPDVVQAMRLGAIDFLKKPATPSMLRRAIQAVLGRQAAGPEQPMPEQGDFEAHLTEAKRFLNAQQFDAAWVHLSRALESSDRSPEALSLAGVFFEMQGDEERASKLYRKALAYRPDYEPAHESLRRLFADLPAAGDCPVRL